MYHLTTKDVISLDINSHSITIIPTQKLISCNIEEAYGLHYSTSEGLVGWTPRWISGKEIPFYDYSSIEWLCKLRNKPIPKVLQPYLYPLTTHDDLQENAIMTTNQLINIQQQTIGNDTVNAVSARELHKFLESKRQFTNWVSPYVSEDNDYGFIQGTDFIRIDAGVNPTNGVPIIDYWFTIDMAKEVSMLSKTEKGKQARKYFIECERKANNPQQIASYDGALKLLGVPEQIVPVIAKVYEERDEAIAKRHLLDDKRTATAMATAANLSIENKKLKAQLNKSYDYATIRTVEKFVKGVVLKWRALKKYCEERKLPILDVPDPLHGTIKSYPAEAWDKVYGVKLNDILKGK